MRIRKRISLALLAALTCATPTMAQDDRFSFNAAVGPSFANLGTTFSSRAGLDVRLNERASDVVPMISRPIWGPGCSTAAMTMSASAPTIERSSFIAKTTRRR